MKTMVTLLCVGVAVLALCLAGGAPAGGGPGEKAHVKAGDYTLSGPYTHKNITVFLVHGADTIKGKKFLTLQEALKKGVVIVYETGDVQKLTIENKSAGEYVYVQWGEIVKGGKQDRVIRYDLVLKPKSGKVPLASFCVEHGRWTGRGNEAVTNFESSGSALATKELKLATKKSGSQQKVWSGVAKVQNDLARNVGGSVKGGESPSSLQLTLENKKVQAAAAAYVKQLAPIVEGKEDVVGFAFAINGEVNSADVYASGALFRKLWPKLIEASAIEAIAAYEKGKAFEAATAEDVKACLLDADKARAVEEDIAPHIRMRTRETAEMILFETESTDGEPAVVHRGYVNKEE